MKKTIVVAKLFSSPPLCSGELSVQVAVEMPFNIKTIESPTHKIKLKVSMYAKQKPLRMGHFPHPLYFKVMSRKKMSTVFG